MQVVVIGGTGFVGAPFVRALAERNDLVVVASRDPRTAREGLPTRVTSSSLEPGELRSVLSGADAVVNLAGENLASGRWTTERKRRFRESRVGLTGSVVNLIGELPAERRPRVLVNASAIGFYGDTGEQTADDDAASGEGYLARLCTDWEGAALEARAHGVRVAIPRLGIVLARGGGVLEQMETPFRMFAGGPIGSGRQWVSWIHRDDLVGILLHAVDDTALSGPFNAASPDPVRMSTFAAALGQALGRPSWIPAPTFAMRLALGREKADSILASSRVVPKRLLETGFTFGFPDLQGALRDLYAEPRPKATTA